MPGDSGSAKTSTTAPQFQDRPSPLKRRPDSYGSLSAASRYATVTFGPHGQSMSVYSALLIQAGDGDRTRTKSLEIRACLPVRSRGV
jgi:hypothetical protein